MAKGEGSYANGRVQVEPLPAEVHGPGAVRELSLRRLEAVLSAKEEEEHVARELQKVGSGGVGSQLLDAPYRAGIPVRGQPEMQPDREVI